MEQSGTNGCGWKGTRTNCVVDVCDGSLVQKHNAIMRARFNEVRLQFEKENLNENLYMCSTWLNAGMVLLERDDNSIWPMLSTFLNRELSTQKASSLGLLVDILRNIYIGTYDEVSLEDGVLLRFEHPTNASLTVAVFLQVRFVRFVFAHLDERAMQNFANIQGCSYECTRCHNRVNDGRRIYLGERVKLHKDHPLRYVNDLSC